MNQTFQFNQGLEGLPPAPELLPGPLEPRSMPVFAQPPLTGGLTPFAGSPNPILPTIGRPPEFPWNIPSLNTLDPQSFILQDNETADLIWNYPNPPHPQNPQSSYRRVGCISDGSCLFHSILKGISPLYLFSYKVPLDVTEELLQAVENTSGNRVRFPDYIFNFPRNPQDITARYQIMSREQYALIMDKFRYEFAAELRSDFAYKIRNDPRMKSIVRTFLEGPIQLKAQQVIFQMVPDLQQRMLAARNGRLPEELIEANPQIVEYATEQIFLDLSRELLSGGDVQPDFLVLLSEYTNFDFYLLRDIDLRQGNPKVVPLYGGEKLNNFTLGPQDMRPANDPKKTFPNRPAIVIISISDNHYELVGRVDVSPDGRRDFKVNFDQAEPLVRTLYLMLSHLKSRSD